MSLHQASLTQVRHPYESTRWQKVLTLTTSVSVLSLKEIDTANQSFEAEIDLICQTHNASEISVTSTTPPTSLNLTNFEPRIKIANLIETKMWVMSSTTTSEGNEMTFRYRVKGIFSEIFELNSFPFDSQLLSIHVTSKIPLSKLQFVESDRDHSKLEPCNFAQSNVFTLTPGIKFKSSRMKPTWISHSDQLRSQLSISMIVSRQASYFVWNLILPQVCLNLLSLTSFASERQNTSGRLGVSVTMLLTTVAFKLQAGKDLPKVSYLTMMDWFMLSSFVFNASVVAENALASDRAGFIDNTAEIIIQRYFFVVWVLHTLTIIFEAFRHTRKSALQAIAEVEESTTTTSSSGTGEKEFLIPIDGEAEEDGDSV